MKKTIAVLGGDGIGPEVVEQGVQALDAVAARFGHRFEYLWRDCGGAALDRHGTPLPEETLAACRGADAILFGAAGGPKWDHLPPEQLPEAGSILRLRKEFDLFANLRPIRIHGPLGEASSLKPERIEGGLDLLIVRELTSGVYFGKHDRSENEASDLMYYHRREIERIVRVACEAAMKRARRLTEVDKSNALASSRLWRDTARDLVAREFPRIELKFLYVDNAAMQLATWPRQFDVIVTENMFGDILSDLGAALTGGLGMLPSASINNTGFGLYEPVHGSAPDIAGKDVANPLATILSVAMMLRYSFNMGAEADVIDAAVTRALDAGFRTRDIAAAGTPASRVIGCREMGRRVAEMVAA
ncbi:MAG: 3-isopropylmalate dehydrogenase [Planctomycetes bacterium]|nr:3-isopropylmalate dehydrogenase [Planctomycetota bacterium]